MQLRAVIFDWAGTTVDFGSRAPVEALLDLFDAAGVPITPAEARLHMGIRKKDHIRSILDLPRVREAWATRHGSHLDPEQSQRLYSQFIPRQIDALARHSQIIPGVAEVVSEMRRRGLRIGSTTGYTRAMLDVILPHAAQAGYAPDASVTPDEVGGGRPAPWMCYLNLIRLGVYPASACLKIGDTPSDIEEGRNAGMWTIALVDSGNEIGLSAAEWDALSEPGRQRLRDLARARLQAPNPDFIANRISEVLPILDQLSSRQIAPIPGPGIAI